METKSLSVNTSTVMHRVCGSVKNKNFEADNILPNGFIAVAPRKGGRQEGMGRFHIQCFPDKSIFLGGHK